MDMVEKKSGDLVPQPLERMGKRDPFKMKVSGPLSLPV